LFALLLCASPRRAPHTLAQVSWMVFSAPRAVPPAQVLAFMAYIGRPEHSISQNARPLQPLNGRVVTRVALSSRGV
jgi:carbonic anhydrase